MQQLRNISNFDRPFHSQPEFHQQDHHEKKIVHQLNNEGCKCTLCQKVVLNQMKIVQRIHYNDVQSEHTKGAKQHYLLPFLNEFYCIDKMSRKIKVSLPQICVFQNGTPHSLLSKKKDFLPMKFLKNKQKMNAFEIQNFFMDGYIFHNSLKDNPQIMKHHKVTTLKRQYYKFDEYLKNQCIVLVNFKNGDSQMMTPTQLNNLFKCKQKQLRQDIRYIQSMVCSSNYNQMRVHIDLQSRQWFNSQLYQRAKNEAKMINQNLKPKDLMFVPQKQQRKFEEALKLNDQKQYLKYLSLKMLLIYSLKTDVLLQKSLFKFVKDQKLGNYYLIDLQSYENVSAGRLWGQFQKKKAESPQKQHTKRRPASSPQKLQSFKKRTEDQDLQNVENELKKLVFQVSDAQNFTYHFKKHQADKKEVKKIQSKIQSGSLLKLEPIKRNSQRTKRLMSSLVNKDTQTSRALKRFL